MPPSRVISGIQVVEVRIRNFRSIQSADVTLAGLTILIGENNAGKTAFLQALCAAIGVGQPALMVDDMYLAPDETAPPKDRSIVIDVLIRPTDGTGKIVDTFQGEFSYWSSRLWQRNVGQDDKDHEFLAIRTRLEWNVARAEYMTERVFLADWPEDPGDWGAASVGAEVQPKHIEPLALYYIDARRDIHEEIRTRGSAWHHMFSDPGLSEASLAQLEAQLNDLNAQIVVDSPVLTHVQDHLNALYQTVSRQEGQASIIPLARNLRDLSRGIDVSLSTRGAHAFPLHQHGMGTRSFGAILTFRAYSIWRQENVKDGMVHPMLALEEPESHLHPQAQRTIFQQIQDMPGQCIVSTHSPYIIAQADLGSLRHFSKTGAETQVTRFDTSSLSKEDLFKVQRKVLQTHGDLLFARAVVLFEGQETEDQAFPIFAEAYWGCHPNLLGISLISVGGAGNYLPFLHLLNSLGIPWYLFSDGEPVPLGKVADALGKIGINDYRTVPNVFILPDGHNFESYLVSQGYADTLTRMLDDYHQTQNYLDGWMRKTDGQTRQGDTKWDFSGPNGRNEALIEVLSRRKGRYGAHIARHITKLTGDQRIPLRIRELFARMTADLGLAQKGGN